MSIIPHQADDMRRCPSCKEWRPLADFYQVKDRPGKYHAYCRPCQRVRRMKHYETSDPETNNARQRERYNKNKESFRAAERKFRQQHPGYNSQAVAIYRTRKAENGGSLTPDEWAALCARYDNRCVACGAQTKLVADHIVPVSKGGPTTIENTQPLCISCNSRKRDRVIDYRH